MSEGSYLKTRREGPVLRLTLNRPEKMNALRDETNIALFEALETVARDDNIRVVILDSVGRAFSAGYDISEGEDMPERTPAYWRDHFRLAFRTLHRIWTLPQPVIAAVQGACLGGGFSLALACDLIYAGDKAFFGDPEIKFGGLGNLFPVLQWNVGQKLFNEMMLTGRRLHSQEAARVQIVNAVVPQAALSDHVDRVARHMCLLPDGTLTRNKIAARRPYEVMGLGPLMAHAEDQAALALAAAPASEFTELCRSEGVTAALAWQKERFKVVGVFE